MLNAAAAKAGYEDANMVCSFSNLPEQSDFQSNGAFALAKRYGNPFVIAENIVKNITPTENFTFFALKPAYINIKMTDKLQSRLANDYLANPNLDIAQIGTGQKVLIDYGGPNLGKAMHIGHMRSFNIGESLKRLYRKLGYEVISDIFMGDWGMPLGLIIAQLEEDGVLDFYFKQRGDKPVLTLDMMNEAYPKASKRKESDLAFKAKAEDYTLRFQKGEQPYRDIWSQLRGVSMAAVRAICQTLNVEFELWNGESDANPYVDTVIQVFQEKGLATVSYGGALIVEVAEEGEQIPIPKTSPEEVQRYENPMPPLILKKSNGGDMYSTSDIATVYYRNEKYHPDILQYLTDNRQAQHFTQIFRACKKAGISPVTQTLIHTSFGTMNGKDGKPFKTRDGGTLKLEDLLDTMIARAKQKLIENGVAAPDDLAVQIAIGALKFGDLSTAVEKDCVFDMDKFLAFEGKTGPYIQYTVCRIQSILDKANCDAGTIQIESVQEKNILMAILKLQLCYQTCLEEKSLAGLCNATYELASAFSSLYANQHILSEANMQKKSSLISLLILVKQILLNALETLAIDVPEKM